MLYIANCTKQNYVHCFRFPESGRPQKVEIPSGQQQMIGQNWSSEQLDAVIRHLEIYGGRKATDRKLENFHGLLYSTDKPIKEHQIVGGHEKVMEHQDKVAADEAVKSAAAFDISNREGKKAKGKRLAKVTEVEVEQDVPARQKPTGQEIHMKVSVSEDGRDRI